MRVVLDYKCSRRGGMGWTKNKVSQIPSQDRAVKAIVLENAVVRDKDIQYFTNKALIKL